MKRVPSERSEIFIGRSNRSPLDDATDCYGQAPRRAVPLALDASRAWGCNKKLLIVDDDPIVRHLTRAFLADEGFRVFTCGDCSRAAMLFSDRNTVDALIVDIELPNALGIQLARLLSSFHPSLPVILASRSTPVEAISEEIDRNGWQFLTKPFHIPELLSAVRRAVGPPARAIFQPFSSLARFLDDGE